jgi:hypothetical protein
MVDNNIFHDISENKADLIKNEFDKKIDLIGMQITAADQLVGLNKRVISEMVNDLDRHRVKGSTKGSALSNPKGSALSNPKGSTLSNPAPSGMANPIDPPPYNSSEIGQQRQQKFATELKNKQNEFDMLNNKQVPNKIDFLDKNEDMPIGDMENLLAAQIAARERELNIVLGKQDKTAASNWIQNGQAPAAMQTATSMQTNVPAAKQLKIGEPIQIEEKEILNPVKKVKFMEGVPPGVPSPNDGNGVPSPNDGNGVPPPNDGNGYGNKSDNSNYGTEDFMTMLKKKSNIVQAPAVQAQAPAVQAPSSDPFFNIREMLEEILIKQDMIMRMLINNKIEIGNEPNIDNISKE